MQLRIRKNQTLINTIFLTCHQLQIILHHLVQVLIYIKLYIKIHQVANLQNHQVLLIVTTILRIFLTYQQEVIVNLLLLLSLRGHQALLDQVMDLAMMDQIVKMIVIQIVKMIHQEKL